MLADSDYRHALEMDLEPFKGLLLAVFFIAVGAGIDFGLLGRMPVLLLGIVVGFMALKLAVLWLLAIVFRMPRADASRFSVRAGTGRRIRVRARRVRAGTSAHRRGGGRVARRSRRDLDGARAPD